MKKFFQGSLSLKMRYSYGTCWNTSNVQIVQIPNLILVYVYQNLTIEDSQVSEKLIFEDGYFIKSRKWQHQ